MMLEGDIPSQCGRAASPSRLTSLIAVGGLAHPFIDVPTSLAPPSRKKTREGWGNHVVQGHGKCRANPLEALSGVNCSRGPQSAGCEDNRVDGGHA